MWTRYENREESNMSIDKELLLHSVRIKSDLLAPVGNQEFYKKVTDNVSLFDSEEYTTAQQIAMFKGKTIPFKLLSTTESIEKYTLKNYMNYIRFIGQSIIHTAFNELHVPDNTELTRWKTGSEMSPHSDNSWPDGRTEEHPTSFRTWSGIYYINDDYEGGELYFPELDWNFKPKADTLLMFPSTSRYIHGVNKVTKVPDIRLRVGTLTSIST
jgi:predicted 2-oxoglutarate/Fe(II)-dependent dioxygenase YbiX